MKTFKTIFFRDYKALSLCFFLILFFLAAENLSAQTLYIDAVKGKAGEIGTIDHPLASLEEAILRTNSFTGQEAVYLKLAPGTYFLAHQMNIKTADPNDIKPYTIEAMELPDQSNWEQNKMPIIIAVSGNSVLKPFICSIGFSIEKHNVNFKGLKIMGNSNTDVTAYYAIKRDNRKLTGLNISQCYFIGEKEGRPIEGALWLTGEGIHIDHSIFSNSKTAIILAGTVNDFSLKNSIITGSYESAIWFAGAGTPFVFSNNVIINSKYVMVHPENKVLDYKFMNSNFFNNEHYIGAYGTPKDNQVPVPFPTDDHKIQEKNINKTAKIELVEMKDNRVPRMYLNLSPKSAGKNTKAGIFTKNAD